MKKWRAKSHHDTQSRFRDQFKKGYHKQDIDSGQTNFPRNIHKQQHFFSEKDVLANLLWPSSVLAAQNINKSQLKLNIYENHLLQFT